MSYTANFWNALRFVEKWEGFFSNDNADPGGKTKYGISDAGDGTVDGLIDLDRDGKGDVKVEELTKGQAVEYLWRYYWEEAGCASAPWPYAAVLFDTAVNCGVGRVRSWDRRAAGDVRRFLEQRISHYGRIVDANPKLKKYYRGWINRVVDLKKLVDIENAAAE